MTSHEDIKVRLEAMIKRELLAKDSIARCAYDADTLIQALEYIKRLEAIVDKYPKTRDGKSITLGMIVYEQNGHCFTVGHIHQLPYSQIVLVGTNRMDGRDFSEEPSCLFSRKSAIASVEGADS